MNYNELYICLACCSISCFIGAIYDFRYFSRRVKALSDRIDKLALQIDNLESERDKFEK